MIEKILRPERNDDISGIFGNKDENITVIEDAFAVSIILRNDEIKIVGEDDDKCKKAESVLQRMLELSTQGELITKQLTAILM